MLTQIFSGTFDPTTTFFWLVGLVIAITFHEAAHALVADWLGDLTPRLLGRVTLDPLAHLDPLGTILILLTGFGWGKPVAFNPLSMRNPALGSTLVALAGPTTNFILAVLFGSLIRFGVAPANLWAQIALINIVLGVFNLLPFYPLDGEKVVGGLLPWNLRGGWVRLQQYGIYLLILAVLVLPTLLTPVIYSIFSFVSGQKL